ncbi:endonuclease domain-containing protein [Sphingomonas hengshuiensis]
MLLPEVLLWQALRKRPGAFKFRRQHPQLEYQLDFACLETRLAIEVDGEAHARGTQPQRDAVRDERLAALGFATLRIPAAEILRDLDAVITGIVTACRARSPLHHRPAAGGPPPRSGEE